MSPKKDNKPKINGRLKDLIHRYEDSKVAKEIEDNFKLSQIRDYDTESLELFRLFDEDLYSLEAFSLLEQEIEKDGQLFPAYLYKEPENGKLMVFSGVKRYLLAKHNRRALKAAIIENIDDIRVTSYALDQIFHNKDNPLVISKAFNEIKETYNISYEELAALIGSSKSQIINYIKLLDLPKAIKKAIIMGQLSYGEARPLNGLKSEVEKHEVFELIQKEKLSVRAIEELVRQKKNPEKSSLRRVYLENNKIIIKCSSKEDALKLLARIKEL